MHIPQTIKQQLRDALVAFDNARAQIEQTYEDARECDDESYRDTLDTFECDMNDILGRMFTIDTEISHWVGNDE